MIFSSFFFLFFRKCRPVVFERKEESENPVQQLREGTYVYKIFDYRGRDVDEDQRRKPDLFYKYMKDTRTVYDEKDFCLLVMPFLEGSHFPSCAGDFLPIVDQIEEMHDNNDVHGDLRLANIIFNGEKSQVIDFDWSGKAKGKCYPKGWVLKIPDGERQTRVKAGRQLRKEHDCVALLGMMKLFREK